MRLTALLAVAWVAGAMASGAVAAEPHYRVQRGDTLWDLSGRFWHDEAAWPELWALNPQFHNPHWILPGDPVFLERGRPTHRVVRLPVAHLRPGGAAGAAAPTEEAGGGAAPGQAQAAAPGAGPARFRLARHQGQDFVSPSRVARTGTVANRQQTKETYTVGEDVEIELTPGATVRPGDRVTLLTDERAVTHPITGEAEGYYVEIRGHAQVRSVAQGRAVARILEAYGAVQDGFGVVPFREPVREVPVVAPEVGVEGVIVGGRPGLTLFGEEDAVILDRGSLHGLDRGVLLDVPTWEGERAAQGTVDLESPLARVLVVAVQERTATAVIVDSRAAVEPGDRFVSAPFSP
ncbi:MAG: hypothetical protein Kow0092_26250 [Deferrisomatales bacterium]